MTQEYDVERIEGRTIEELAQLNAELLEALQLIASRVEEPRDDDEGVAHIPFHKETLAPMYEAIRKAE